LSLLIASLAGRRAVAAALTVGVYLVSFPVYGVLVGIAFGRSGGDGELTGSNATLAQLAGLVSPVRIVQLLSQWWFGVTQRGGPERGGPDLLGPYGPYYLAAAIALFVVCILLLLLRYRKVAR